DGIHAGETGGGHVLFLAFQRDMFARFGSDLQQERAGTAGWVVGGGGGAGVCRGDADDLGNDAAYLGRRVDLALALAAFGSEVAHEVFVGVAEDVVVLGAVLGEVQLGLSEDRDQVGEALYPGRAVAELVGVVEVRKVAAGEP